tara:strand:- start:570 stop:821 length:252 start_codon:yes stop_codon:yes gene_type:complete
MPFLCYLCSEETCYTTYFCNDCNYIKRILQCYGREEIKDIVTKVCIRNKQQRENKVDILKKKLDNHKIDHLKVKLIDAENEID